MPWIERVRTEQPLDAGVGIDEAFAGKLLDGFVGAAGLTLKGKVITDTANISKAASALGTSRRGAANAGFSFPSDLTSTNSITVVCQFVQYARTGTQLLIEHSVNGNFNAGTFLLYTDATAGRLILGTSASSNYDAAYVALPALGSVITVAMRLRFTASSTATDDLGIWVNGVAPTLTGVTSTSATNNFGNFTTYFLSRAASSLQADAAIGMYAVLSGFASDTDLKSLSINPWQLFEKERIFVPLTTGGDTAAITQADGTSTAGTLGGAASAASAPTAADGTSTAASIAASAIAAAGVASADGTSTASTLAGSAVNAAAITQADGSTVASVLAGSATSSAAATQADGVSTVGTLAGSATAASVLSSADGSSSTSTAAGSATSAAALTQADGLSTVSTLTGAGTGIAAFTQADGVSTTGTLTGTGLAAGSSTITPAAGSTTAGAIAGSSTAIAAITQADGTTTAGTLSSSSVSPAVMTAGAGTSTTSTLAGSSIFAAAMTQASGATTASAFAASAVAACVAIAAAGASSAQALAGIPPNTSNLAGIIYEVPEDVRSSIVLADARGFTVLEDVRSTATTI